MDKLCVLNTWKYLFLLFGDWTFLSMVLNFVFSVLKVFQQCPQGHFIWSSQPALKFGSQLGDFLMASYILLSGNNYTKVKLLFRFMNMGMMNDRYYCVDTTKTFWNAKRAEVIRIWRHRDQPLCLVYNTHTYTQSLEITLKNVAFDQRQWKHHEKVNEKSVYFLSFNYDTWHRAPK